MFEECSKQGLQAAGWKEVLKMWSKTWIVVLGTDDDCPVERVYGMMAPRMIGWSFDRGRQRSVGQ